MATLGKRVLREEANDWAPGTGLSAAATADAERAAFDRRTSLLFLELQNSVHEALRWRHARDAKARKASHCSFHEWNWHIRPPNFADFCSIFKNLFLRRST